ncbi:hypothetical protein K458DRAFT_129777 [Lentithecium fluviatile CBS 122367]|uniref:Uncharacterized protein n=1 Tax=Lentithecium fluviatile CBS 122367 TaxID=1168545 RepID=A0A6G1JH88_9PLEO|nr:hypothetical protein K458DRAFT_129777 [Lentithecium fluviatile CBS 122367]
MTFSKDKKLVVRINRKAGYIALLKMKIHNIVKHLRLLYFPFLNPNPFKRFPVTATCHSTGSASQPGVGPRPIFLEPQARATRLSVSLLYLALLLDRNRFRSGLGPRVKSRMKRQPGAWGEGANTKVCVPGCAAMKIRTRQRNLYRAFRRHFCRSRVGIAWVEENRGEQAAEAGGTQHEASPKPDVLRIRSLDVWARVVTPEDRPWNLDIISGCSGFVFCSVSGSGCEPRRSRIL